MEWEFMFLDWIQNNVRSDVLDTIFPLITFLGNGGWFWIALTLVGLFFRRTRRYAMMSGMALVLCLVIGNLILKPGIARIRPFDINQTVSLLIEAPHDYSFPSGHTQASFAAAIAVCFWKRSYGIAAVVLATLIAFSRLYLYVHYPTDVLAGIGFGILYAAIGWLIVTKVLDRKCGAWLDARSGQ